MNKVSKQTNKGTNKTKQQNTKRNTHKKNQTKINTKITTKPQKTKPPPKEGKYNTHLRKAQKQTTYNYNNSKQTGKK